MSRIKIRADIIKKALADKHRNKDDLFITEVKTGPTLVGNRKLFILDALAIKKSWARPLFTGYEIKTSRSDFTSDDKWYNYLPYCHNFYFVCPSGLIKKEELPDKVGLMYYNPKKGTLWTAKKAFYRDIAIDANMLYYILISRIDSDRHPFFSNEREYYEAWVKDKIESKELGWKVASKFTTELSSVIEEKNDALREVRILKNEVELLDEIRSLMRKYHLKTYNYIILDELEKAIISKIPKTIQDGVSSIQKGLELIKYAIDQPITAKGDE